MKKKFDRQEEKKASIRNDLTLPMTVLGMVAEGKKISKEEALLALKELRKVIKKI